MFNSAHRAAKGIVSKGQFKPGEVLSLSSQCLPKRYSLSEVYNELNSQDKRTSKENILENILILAGCLGNLDRVVRESTDNDAINNLLLWICKAILPEGNLIPQDEVPEDSQSASRRAALTLTHQASTLGLQSFSLLITQFPSLPPQNLDAQVLLALLAFTNPGDPWTTPAASETAHSLLSSYSDQAITSDFIVSFLLQTFIRPLFSKSKPASITSTGRRAMPSSAPSKRFEAADLDRSSKPWKYEVIYSIAVFRWILENSPSALISSSWHLFIPPLLTLLDDQSTSIRVAGSQMVTSFLPHLTPTLLSQSGLDQVFEDALMPSLLYLPNLTPPEESLLLLPATYKALGVLCDVRFPSFNHAATSLAEKNEEQQKQVEEGRIKLLDRILRAGIFPGYAHAHEHIRIVEELVRQLQILVSNLGIHAVKHLKDILPILLPPLSDPFMPLSWPSLLLACVLALQSTVLNTWPRIGAEGHRTDILKGVAIGWKNVTDTLMEDKDGVRKKELEAVKGELKVLGRLFVTAAETDVGGNGEDGVRGEVDRLASKAEGTGLGELFGV